MGSITLGTPFQPLSAGNQTQNQGQANLGAALMPWKYSGQYFEFTADASATGNPAVFTLSSVPADAIGIEFWVNGNAADDYVFFQTQSGLLSSTGIFASNIAANLASSRWVASGAKAIIPFQSMGAAPSTLRCATGKAAAKVQGRYISKSSGFPYLLGAATPSVLIGAGASIQLPYTDPTRFPVGYCGVVMQINGAGPVRITTDGTTVNSTNGDLISPGTYLIDQSLHGISLAALRMHLPVGTNVVANSLVYA